MHQSAKAAHLVVVISDIEMGAGGAIDDFPQSPSLLHWLEQLPEADRLDLVFSGVETDICVLGSVLDAVDRGYRVVIASDAVTSSDLASHEATLGRICRRFDVQIELATTEEVLAAWS